MNRLSKLAILGGGAVLAAWTAWGLYAGRSAESVPYERVRAVDGVELRRYPQTVLVETTAGDQITAFRRLFQYISGANRGREEIAMTAPVATTEGTNIAMTAPVRTGGAQAVTDVRMAFYLPTDYDPESAPEPTDSNVRLITEPAKTLAVTEFSWYAPRWRVARIQRDLSATLERHGIERLGEPYLLRYDDPWTPPYMRRNEVAVEVADDRF